MRRAPLIAVLAAWLLTSAAASAGSVDSQPLTRVAVGYMPAAVASVRSLETALGATPLESLPDIDADIIGISSARSRRRHGGGQVVARRSLRTARQPCLRERATQRRALESGMVAGDDACAAGVGPDNRLAVGCRRGRSTRASTRRSRTSRVACSTDTTSSTATEMSPTTTATVLPSRE